MRLKRQEIDDSLQKLQGWQYADESIKKEFKLKDFSAAMGFVVKIALAAEVAQHHPDMTIEYNRVKIVLTTHSEEGLTEKDFALAEKIENLLNA